MSQALLEIAALSERVTALAGSIQDSMPSHYDSVNENVDQIKRSVESSLEALVSLSSARAETLRDNA